MKTTFIYCLTEPETKTIRYFGKADNPKKRFWQHLYAERRLKHLHCARWIAGLHSVGKKPDLHVLCEVPQDDFERFERAFIALGRQYEFPLTNLSDGGEGASGIIPSPETRAKISAKAKGRAVSPETRAKISAAHTGRKLSPEHCAKMSAAVTGRKDSPETRLKKSLAAKGVPKSREAVENSRRALTGRKLSPEHCAKLSRPGPLNHNYGKPAHPAVLARLREKRPDAGSKFFGVCWSKAAKKWVVQLSSGRGKTRQRGYLGCYSDEVEAAQVYDAAVKKLQVPFAKLNFP